MEYSYQAVGASLLFNVHGDLTMFNVSRPAEAIARASEQHSSSRVVINAEHVALIDSAAFGYLIKHNATLSERGGLICFAHLRPNVKSALAQLHLDETLVAYGSLAEALDTEALPQDVIG